MTDLAGERGISVTGNTLAGTGAVFRHELRLLLYQPLSYLFQLGFLAVLAASVFLIADFYATDEASIRLLLVFLPWVALILVPALAMRAWIEDHSDRSMELILTLPVSVGAVVLGKFLAGYLVLIVTLLFTLPLVATVYYLGEPDSGDLFAGYLAFVGDLLCDLSIRRGAVSGAGRGLRHRHRLVVCPSASRLGRVWPCPKRTSARFDY